MKDLLVLCLFAVAAAALPQTPLSRVEGGSFSWLSVEGVNDHNRIVGGEVAEKNSLPYQAGVFVKLDGSNRGLCGGVLISDQHVLTAASCLWNGTSIVASVEVHLGIHNIFSVDANKTTFNSTNFLVHPGWIHNNFEHNIAILTAPRRIQLTGKIQPIALPSRSDVGDSFRGATALASGWGWENDLSASVSPELRQVKLSIISNSLCRVYFFSTLKSSHICSAPSRIGICRGDIGGPLVTLHDGQQILIGLASYTAGWGCDALYPSVFTRITEYLDWVSENTNINIREHVHFSNNKYD